MRLLLVNGNTSLAVTDALVSVAREAASPGTDIVPATAARGVPVIQTMADLDAAMAPMLEAVSEHIEGCDGVLVGVSMDLAVPELRQRWNVPVVGMTGAALTAAGRDGGHVGVITFGAGMRTLLRQRFPQVDAMRIETVDMAPGVALTQRSDPAPLLELLTAAANRLAGRGAQRVLPIGATVAGLASRVSARVPVLDCTACAVSELERLVHARGKGVS